MRLHNEYYSNMNSLRNIPNMNNNQWTNIPNMASMPSIPVQNSLGFVNMPIPMYPYFYNVLNFPAIYSTLFNPIRQNDINGSNLAAVNAYIYGYPLVLMMITRAMMLDMGYTNNKLVNQTTIPSTALAPFIQPNMDMLYSIAWLDLSNGPLLLRVPDTYGIYYIIQLLDPWTNVFDSLGTRTTGTRPNNFIIVGPNFEGDLPDDYIAINSPNNYVMLIIQTQATEKKDLNYISSIVQNYVLSPLTPQTDPYSFEPKIPDEFQKYIIPNKTPKEIVDSMDAKTFFEIMTKAMYVNPPAINDPEINATLNLLGIEPNNNFNYDALPTNTKQLLEYAVKYGPTAINENVSKIYNNNLINQWALIRNNIGTYEKDYSRRAAIANISFLANLPEDEIFAISYNDIDGIKLTGNNNYIIHFEKENLPPVNAFWSLTLYDKNGQLFNNPSNKFFISPSAEKLNYNKDGSLDIYIQHDSPGGNKETNWLPTPKDNFYLNLRLYWPKKTALSKVWNPPKITRII